MIIAVTYGDKNFTQSTKYNLKSAIKYGKVDKVIAYSPEDIDEDFRNKNLKILSTPKGAGYWLWKPYIVKKTLDSMNAGDYMVYSDSGTFYINDLHNAINIMEEKETDLYLSNVDYLESMYSKRDAFVYIGVDNNQIAETKQMDAAFFLIKKTNRTIMLIDEWLRNCCNYNIISDDENIYGLSNYEGFIENRYDQTVFSLTCKKYGYKSFGNVSKPNPYFTCIEPLSLFTKSKYYEYYKGIQQKRKLIEEWNNTEFYAPFIIRTRFRNMNSFMFYKKIMGKKMRYYYRNVLSFNLTKIYVEMLKKKEQI